MALDLFDTHCHIHSIGADSVGFTAKKWQDGGVQTQEEVIQSAREAGISRLLLVGTDLDDSRLAAKLAAEQENCWASVGIHPHEAEKFQAEESLKDVEALLKKEKVVAIGECGLDFYYEHSPKREQIKLLEYWLDKAQNTQLPVIFHVRDAHADFWPIFDNFKNIKGVMHSFSATTQELEQALSRNLYIGLNGIMTFSRNEQQLTAAKNVPIERLLVETDAPYLTPNPFRGKICKPEHVALTAHFLAELRQESLQQLAHATTRNACELFNIASSANN